MRKIPAPISQIPTRLNVDQAWAEYVALVRRMDEAPSLRTNLGHCQAIARAWQRWFDTFLQMDTAA